LTAHQRLLLNIAESREKGLTWKEIEQELRLPRRELDRLKGELIELVGEWALKLPSEQEQGNKAMLETEVLEDVIRLKWIVRGRKKL
jgi:hypothetical protein